MIRFPHCDSRVLHAPGECVYCDRYPDEQARRSANRINFTGHANPGKEPCPADAARPPGSESDHRRWGGNKPTSASDHPEGWPEETFASRVLYSEPETRR